MTFDRRDDRLRQLQAGRAHRRRPLVAQACLRLLVILGHRLEVGAGAEMSACAGEDGDARTGLGLEVEKRTMKGTCGCGIDGIAALGSVDRDDSHRPLVLHPKPSGLLSRSVVVRCVLFGHRWNLSGGFGR